MRRPDSYVLTVSRRSPRSWARASSSLRKQTMLVRVPLSTYFFMQPRQLTHASSSLRKQTTLVWVSLSAYFFVAQVVEHVLAVAFRNKLCCFKSHYSHISLCIHTTEAIYWRELLSVYDGCAWDPGWLCSRFVSGVGWGVKYCSKMCSFQLLKQFIIFLSCGLLVDNYTF